MIVARFTANGVDRSFGGGDGAALVGLPRGGFVSDVAVRRDGRVVAVGTAEVGPTGRMAVIRLLADGRLDRSFGGDGVVLDAPPGRPWTGGGAAAVDSSGRALAAGSYRTGPTQPFDPGGALIARYAVAPRGVFCSRLLGCASLRSAPRAATFHVELSQCALERRTPWLERPCTTVSALVRRAYETGLVAPDGPHAGG